MEFNRWIREDLPINISSSFEGERWESARITKVGPSSFFIALPRGKKEDFQPEVGSRLRVKIPLDDGLFQFSSRVVSRRTEPEPWIEMEFPPEREVAQVERRAFPRLPVKLETFYAEIHGGSGLLYSSSQALDISGGGIRMETFRPCHPETLIRVKFRLPDDGGEVELIATGRIVRTIPARGTRKYQAGVEFIDLPPRQQELLVQFVQAGLARGEPQD